MEVDKERYRYYLCYLHILYLINKKYNKNRKRKYPKRKVWVRDIFLNRKKQGDYYNLVQELRLSDHEKHFNYFRMSSEVFDMLLNLISHTITKVYHTREPISPGEKLSCTLRYLASGDSMISISYAYRLGKSTVSNIINETCSAIWDCLSNIYLSKPDSNEWLNIAEGFKAHWQLPNCIGAIDGKHVVIQAPPKAGSEFYNYKNSHSLILLAVSDSKYKFIAVDIGAKGKQSDAGVLRNSTFGQLLFGNDLDVPIARPIEYAGDDIPFYIVGDEAFPLRNNLMRPYSGRNLSQDKRIFNYRLSRGRRVIENAFGILASRFRIFRKPIIASIATTENIIKATICLHNFLLSKKESKNQYCPLHLIDSEDTDGNLIEGQWRTETSENLANVSRSGSNFFSKEANSIRNSLAVYFVTEGAVPYQWNK